MKILTLLLGVAVLGVASGESDQSELSIPDEQPINALGNRRKGRDTPEVFLQLKYDRGELDRIYLTQFRKENKIWNPSVSVQTHLCADLCHAGLGGDVCGATCPQLLPIGLKTALTSANLSEANYGQPRTAVCPALCANHLGRPLCHCASRDEDTEQEVAWADVCSAFCNDGYLLTGCPACPAESAPVVTASFRALDTVEGWQSWCNVQCLQGHGGAACNCDRTPFT